MLDDLLSVVLDWRILHSDHAYISRLLHIQDTDARCGCDLFSRLVIILCVFELRFFCSFCCVHLLSVLIKVVKTWIVFIVDVRRQALVLLVLCRRQSRPAGGLTEAWCPQPVRSVREYVFYVFFFKTQEKRVFTFSWNNVKKPRISKQSEFR